MVKKFSILTIVAFTIFGIFGFSACNVNSLEDYKTTMSLKLSAYAENKGEENYSADGWSAICKAVTDGKVAIEAAESKSAVDSTVTTAKAAIDMVVPILSEELEREIKEDYLREFGHEFYFYKFYGLYNGAAVFFIAGEEDWVKVVTISGVEFGYNTGWTILVWKDGTFYDLEDIETIFDAGILTQKNLETIGSIHSNAYMNE